MKEIQNLKLLEILERLRKIPSFVGSVPDCFASESYMTDKDVIEELIVRKKKFEGIEDFKGCGELTKDERKELSILRNSKILLKGDEKR